MKTCCRVAKNVPPDSSVFLERAAARSRYSGSSHTVAAKRSHMGCGWSNVVWRDVVTVSVVVPPIEHAVQTRSEHHHGIFASLRKGEIRRKPRVQQTGFNRQS